MKHTGIKLLMLCLTLGFIQQAQTCPMIVNNTTKKKLFYTRKDYGKLIDKRKVQRLKKKAYAKDQKGRPLYEGYIVRPKASQSIGEAKALPQEVFIYKHFPKKDGWVLVHRVKENFCVGPAQIDYLSIEADAIPHAKEGKKRYSVEFFDPTRIKDD